MSSICALYATNLSNSTTCITYAQIFVHRTTEGLSTLFGNYFWINENWTWDSEEYEGFGKYANSNEVVEARLKDGSKVNSFSHKVCPTITLNTSVKFSGVENLASTYNLSIT